MNNNIFMKILVKIELKKNSFNQIYNYKKTASINLKNIILFIRTN